MSATPATRIEVHGAGPAGTAASIAARLLGVEVDLYDPSPFPHHRVCGEFLSPEALPILESLGLGDAFASLAPARYDHLVLHFGRRIIRSPLPAPAYGLSRHALDQLLLNHAVSLGACLHRERAPAQCTGPAVIAHGRQGAQSAAPRTPHANRLFGFKAHFNGTAPDPLYLYFAGPTYVGVNRVENGVTNVCGLAPETALHAHAFNIDSFLAQLPHFQPLLAALTRSMSWMTTGPLIYDQRFQTFDAYRYPAGDALSFIDPFTGSGLLSALLTGQLAGTHSARGIPPHQYLSQCRRTLRRPFLAASIVRAVLATPFAGALAAWTPAAWLVHATRPAVSANSFKF